MYEVQVVVRQNGFVCFDDVWATPTSTDLFIDLQNLGIDLASGDVEFPADTDEDEDD